MSIDFKKPMSYKKQLEAITHNSRYRLDFEKMVNPESPFSIARFNDQVIISQTNARPVTSVDDTILGLCNEQAAGVKDKFKKVQSLYKRYTIDTLEGLPEGSGLWGNHFYNVLFKRSPEQQAIRQQFLSRLNGKTSLKLPSKAIIVDSSFKNSLWSGVGRGGQHPGYKAREWMRPLPASASLRSCDIGHNINDPIGHTLPLGTVTNLFNLPKNSVVPIGAQDVSTDELDTVLSFLKTDESINPRFLIADQKKKTMINATDFIHRNIKQSPSDLPFKRFYNRLNKLLVTT
jgi:hypothetical protein